MVNLWCAVWSWLMDHSGSGRVNRIVVRGAELLTPSDGPVDIPGCDWTLLALAWMVLAAFVGLVWGLFVLGGV